MAADQVERTFHGHQCEEEECGQKDKLKRGNEFISFYCGMNKTTIISPKKLLYLKRVRT